MEWQQILAVLEYQRKATNSFLGRNQFHAALKWEFKVNFRNLNVKKKMLHTEKLCPLPHFVYSCNAKGMGSLPVSAQPLSPCNFFETKAQSSICVLRPRCAEGMRSPGQGEQVPAAEAVPDISPVPTPTMG